MFEKTDKKVVKSAGKDLNMPKLQPVESSLLSQPQKSFPNKHLTNILSISPSLNEEYLLSADEAQIFLWSLEDPQKPFMAIDYLADQKVEDMKENISCAKMHPASDSLFVFGTNKGTLKLVDMRVSAICDNTALNFKYETAGKKNFFSDMVSSYSSAELMKGGKYLVSRDYLTVKIWDICNTKKPISVITVQESVKAKLCEMFENDCILDRFCSSASPDGNTILTGNYNNCFHLIDTIDGSNTQYELNYKKTTVSRPMIASKSAPISKMDYLRKTTAGDFSPVKNSLAVASLNCFYIYSM